MTSEQAINAVATTSAQLVQDAIPWIVWFSGILLGLFFLWLIWWGIYGGVQKALR